MRYSRSACWTIPPVWKDMSVQSVVHAVGWACASPIEGKKWAWWPGEMVTVRDEERAVADAQFGTTLRAAMATAPRATRTGRMPLDRRRADDRRDRSMEGPP